MDNRIIEKVEKFVEKECQKPSCKYGPGVYLGHIVPVVEYSKKLAAKMHADKEIVILGALLHDIGSIICGRSEHHITGSEIAELKLKEFSYPTDKIEQVKHCILTHRGSQKIKPETKEAKIVAEADSLSAFDSIDGLFEAALVCEKKNRFEARDSIRNKLKNKWGQLSLESKRMIRDKYDAAMLLLK